MPTALEKLISPQSKITAPGFATYRASSSPTPEGIFTRPSDGLFKWAKAWLAYLGWAGRRKAQSGFAFAAHHGGLDGFKYLWGAPAAAAVISLFFGIVLLDERLGMRQVILNSPPAQWVAELIEEAQTVVLEPSGETNPRGPSVEPNPLAAVIELKARVPLVEFEQPAPLDGAPGTEETALAAAADTAPEPLPRSGLAAAEGAEGRIAPRGLSFQEKPIASPREGSRPDSQTRPKPVAAKPLAAMPPEVPSATANLPVIAKVFEKVEPVLDEASSDLPPAPESVGPVVTAVEPLENALPVEIQTPVTTKDDADGTGNEQAAASAFIQLLQSGGRREKRSESGPGEVKAIERPLRSDGPVAKAERSLVNGKVELPKAAAVSRVVRPEQAPGSERPQTDRPIALDKPIDRIVKPERPPVVERPPLLERPVERIVKPERAPLLERPIERIVKPELPRIKL